MEASGCVLFCSERTLRNKIFFVVLVITHKRRNGVKLKKTEESCRLRPYLVSKAVKFLLLTENGESAVSTNVSTETQHVNKSFSSENLDKDGPYEAKYLVNKLLISVNSNKNTLNSLNNNYTLKPTHTNGSTCSCRTSVLAVLAQRIRIPEFKITGYKTSLRCTSQLTELIQSDLRHGSTMTTTLTDWAARGVTLGTKTDRSWPLSCERRLTTKLASATKMESPELDILPLLGPTTTITSR